MLFTSLSFIYLLLVTFCLYYTPGLRRFQVLILILASFFFYAYNEPLLLLLLIISPAINIITSYYIAHGEGVNRKAIAIAGISFELAILGFFKYSPLFSRTFLNPTGSVGYFLLMIPLPIGISFFTFEGISLVVDVFTEKYFDRRRYVSASLLEHARNIYCFISFFPHLIAGPIVKAHSFLPQIHSKSFRDINWDLCFQNLVLGYFLKMVVADNLHDFTFWIRYPFFVHMDTITLVTLLLGYSCQIFADFAGYSLIALGLAGLFGYTLISNFDFPYISTSFREFWKRWHISLSSFLMEYLYVPLGGNRKGRVRTYVNLMTTMVLGGLWHGAAWSYAVWGAFHGAALSIERFFAGRISADAPDGRMVKVVKRLVVFGFVSLAWLLFKLPQFSHVIEYLKAMIHNPSLGFDSSMCAYIFVYSCPVILYHAWYLWRKQPVRIGERVPDTVRLKPDTTDAFATGELARYDFATYESAVYGVLLFLILMNAGSTDAFIYFQF
jgi:alginate O-acetyltransferase complex protein AlgI